MVKQEGNMAIPLKFVEIRDDIKSLERRILKLEGEVTKLRFYVILIIILTNIITPEIKPLIGSLMGFK